MLNLKGIFVGSNIRSLMKDEMFENVMTQEERMAWTEYKNVVDNFLGNDDWLLLVSKKKQRGLRV